MKYLVAMIGCIIMTDSHAYGAPAWVMIPLQSVPFDILFVSYSLLQFLMYVHLFHSRALHPRVCRFRLLRPKKGFRLVGVILEPFRLSFLLTFSLL
jgi:hypothetical protein